MEENQKPEKTDLSADWSTIIKPHPRPPIRHLAEGDSSRDRDCPCIYPLLHTLASNINYSGKSRSGAKLKGFVVADIYPGIRAKN